MTPENRAILWNQKFTKLIESTSDSGSKQFYEEIKNSLSELTFDSGISSYEFNENWKPIIENLQTQYDWSDDDIYVTFATLFTVTESLSKSSKSLSYSFTSIISAGFSDNCNCRWGGIGCGSDSFDSCKEKKTCPEDIDDEIGCGFLLLQSCTGKCTQPGF